MNTSVSEIFSTENHRIRKKIGNFKEIGVVLSIVRIKYKI